MVAPQSSRPSRTDPPLLPVPPGRARTRRRLRRVVLGACAALAASVVAAGLAAWALLTQLDHPRVKPRVVALVKSASGLGIDYQAVEVSLLHGIHVGSFSVDSPPVFREHAPRFLVVRDVEVLGALWALPFRGASLERLSVGGVQVAVVADASGRTTLDELFPSSSEPAPEPRPPLSHALSGLPELFVERVAISDVRLSLLQLPGEGRGGEVRVEALELKGVLRAGEQGLKGTQLSLGGSPDLRVVLGSSGEPERQASLDAELALRAVDAQTLSLWADVTLADQDLVSTRVPVRRLLQMAAEVQLSAAQGETRFSIQRLSAVDDRITVEGRAWLPDGEPLRARVDGKSTLTLHRLPLPVEGVELSELRLQANARGLVWSPEGLQGSADLAASLEAVDVIAQGARLGVEGARLHGQAKLEKQSVSAHLQLGVAAVAVGLEGGPTARLEQISLEGGGRGSVAADGSPQVERATATLGAKSLLAELALRREVSLDEPSVELVLGDLARSAAAPFGWKGAADVELSLPAVQVLDAGQAFSLRGAKALAALPLTADSAHGSLSWDSARGAGAAAKGVSLSWQVSRPLSLASERANEPASLELHGRLNRLSNGPHQARSLDLALRAERRQGGSFHGELTAEAARVLVEKQMLPGAVSVQLRGEVDPGAPNLQLEARVRGTGGAALDFDLDAGFDRASEKARYEAHLGLRALQAFAGPAARWLPQVTGLRLKGARVRGHARGEWGGVLSPRTEGGLVPAADPLASAHGRQKAELELLGVDYRADGQELLVPKMRVALDSVHRRGGAGRARLSVESPMIALRSEGESTRLRALEQRFDAEFQRPPHLGEVKIDSLLTVGAIEQSSHPELPVRDLRVESTLAIDRLSAFFLRGFELASPATGTTLAMAGAVEQTGRGADEDATMSGREALTLEGTLRQRLEPLGSALSATRASGELSIPFRLESGDLLSYRLQGTLDAERVSFESGDGSLAVEELSGRVPFQEELILLPTGPVIAAGPASNPLARSRFFDVQPFLETEGFVTLRSATARGEQIGPVAANVRLDRSLFAIDQLQAGYAGGQITGQVRADYAGGDPIVDLRLNLTGIRPKRGKGVLDANAALRFLPGSLSLEGKMQIVRISRDHLLEFLDLLDPFHETVNVNKVRLGLQVGYPKFVRLKLHDGVVDTKVQLGGVSRIVRIDEIVAVPLGPLLQKFVAPLLGPAQRLAGSAAAMGGGDPAVGRRAATDRARSAERQLAAEEGPRGGRKQ